MLEKYLNEKWALEETFHNRIAQLALDRMASGRAAFTAEKERREPYAVAVQPTAGSFGYERLAKVAAESGRVAVLPIIGTMSRYGDFCTYGTEEYAGWIIEANNDPGVSAIVLELNTPGGQVDGTEYLGEVIRTSKKPVVAFVAGMAASAGYWIASQCRTIIMESLTSSEVGSIGVLSMHVDASKYYEKEGYKIEIVRADGSHDKALYNSIEPLSDEVRTETKAILNAIRETFIEKVKAGRPGISEEAFTGKMFLGRDALKMKMANAIGFWAMPSLKRIDWLNRRLNH